MQEPPDDLRRLEVEESLLRRLDLSRRTGHDLRIVETSLEEIVFDETEMRGLTLRDVRVQGGSWTTVNADAARLERVELHGVRLTGAAFPSATFADVAFVDCHLDLATFRSAELRNVRFEACRLEEADFYETKLTSVLFTGCDLTQAVLAGATFVRSELRGCTLAAIGNPERLRGVRMPLADAVHAADVLAAAAGIEIVGD